MSQKPKNRVREIFERCGAILKGHFVYTSGLHGKIYVNKKLAMTKEFLPQLASAILEEIDSLGEDVLERTDIVAGPHTGGFQLAEYVAKELGLRFEKMWEDIGQPRKVTIPVVGGTKNEKGETVLDTLPAGCRLFAKNALVVDDILTSGSTLKPFIAALWKERCYTLAAAVLWNRGNKDAESIGARRLISLIDQQFKSWTEEECKIDGPCSRNVPVNTDVGHGREYLIRKQIVEPIQEWAKKMGLEVAAVIGGGKKR